MQNIKVRISNGNCSYDFIPNEESIGFKRINTHEIFDIF